MVLARTRPAAQGCGGSASELPSDDNARAVVADGGADLAG
jgi:hypothetical protein